MKLITIKILSTLVLTLCLTSTANATLMSRLGGDAIYDTESDLTWIANGNAAAGSAFDDGTSSTDGRMTWASANTWAASLILGGFTDWRLPTFGPINGTAFNTSATNDGSTDAGRNISRPGTVHGTSLASEMAYLFYNSLGNVSDYNVSGVFDDGCIGSCLTNAGLFVNLQSSSYWSDVALNSSDAWFFGFIHGIQDDTGKVNDLYALAVRSGDVAAVPVPAAVWLMGTALFGLAGFRRKKAVPAHP